MAVRMPFGKHKGKVLTEIDTEYLEYVLGWDQLREPLRSAIKAELDARRDPSQPDFKLGRDIIDYGFRALAKKHHPDLGGDHDTMKCLNATVEWLRRQVEALC